MLAAIDAQYADDLAAVACITFSAWTDATAQLEKTTLVHGIEPYTPGEFWRRELPCILAALRLLPEAPSVVVIDGYVWLDGDGRKGLGARLFDALGGHVAVVGVAKHPFHGASNAAEVRRGKSDRPLLVTAEGISLKQAEAAVLSMHGGFRVPTLLKRVDQLCRQALLLRS